MTIEHGLLKGLVKADYQTASEIPSFVMIKGVTWEGHDFVDAILDEGNWSKVKAFLKEGGKQVTIDTIKWAVKRLFGVDD